MISESFYVLEFTERRGQESTFEMRGDLRCTDLTEARMRARGMERPGRVVAIYETPAASATLESRKTD